MPITKERKQGLIGDFRRAQDDTGSPEIQIAILTTRIGDITEHLRTHQKDYLKKVDPQRYLDIIRRLDIRK